MKPIFRRHTQRGHRNSSSSTLKPATELKRLTDQCVMCGMCLPHCPTYHLTRDEAESPRGRISLIQGMSSGRLSYSPALAAHLDHCLACRACESVCPSGVRYGEFIAGGRALVAEQRPALSRWQRRFARWGGALITDRRRQGLEACEWAAQSDAARECLQAAA